MLKRERILDALYDKPMTSRELAELFRCSRKSITSIIYNIRDKLRIFDWKFYKSKYLSMVWCLADGKPDAPKPESVATPRDRNKNRNDPESIVQSALRKCVTTQPWPRFL